MIPTQKGDRYICLFADGLGEIIRGFGMVAAGLAHADEAPVVVVE
jgi:hypothetical protein